jgi:hypothetical protein
MPAILNSLQLQSYQSGVQLGASVASKSVDSGGVYLAPLPNSQMGLTPVNLLCTTGSPWFGAAQGNNPYSFYYNISTPDTALLSTILRVMEEPRGKSVSIWLDDSIPTSSSFSVPIAELNIYTNNFISPITGKTVDGQPLVPHLISERLHEASKRVKGVDKSASPYPTVASFQVQSHAVWVHTDRLQGDYAILQLIPPPPLTPVQIFCSPNTSWEGEVTNEGVAPPYSYWYFVTTSDVDNFNSILAQLEGAGTNATYIIIQGAIPPAPEQFDLGVTFFAVYTNNIVA